MVFNVKINIECQFWDTVTWILGLTQTIDYGVTFMSCLYIYMYAALLTFQFKGEILIIHWTKRAMPGIELGINLLAT